MAFNFLIPIRGVQWLFWVILLGLSAYLVSEGDNIYGGSFSANAYSLFCAIWTFLVLIPLSLTTFNLLSSTPVAHPILALVLESLTVIFWFASFIAVAVYVDNTIYVGDLGANIVSSEQALAVFGAFEWVAFVASLAFTIRAFLGGRNKSTAPTATAPSTV